MSAPAEWFAPLNEAIKTIRVDPPDGYLADRFVALLDPTVPDARAGVASIVPDATVYVSLPLATFSGDRVVAQAVGAVPGVRAVTFATCGSAETETLVNGFDVLTSVGQMQRYSTVGTNDVVGGGGEGDVATRPALMTVINFSIGPTSAAYPTRRDDPVNLATLAVSESQMVVAAAGNEGLGDRETMSAWAELPWVLAVGGTEDRAGTVLYDKSSRGLSSEPDSGPDVVSYCASELDDSVRGTSFAAPRVARVALLVSAVLLQARRPWLAALGERAQGTELVGVGFIDSGFEALQRRYASLPGLPALGLDEDQTADCFEAVGSDRGSLRVQGSPQLVRQIVVASARPMPQYGAHEVGAGFVDGGTTIAWLSTRTGLDMIEWFRPSTLILGYATRTALASRRPFDEVSLRELLATIDVSSPVWAYDYRSRQLGRIP